MGKIFSLFVKIPIHAVEDLFPIRERLILEHGEGVQRGPGSVGEIGERECEGPIGFGPSLADDREGVQTQ